MRSWSFLRPRHPKTTPAASGSYARGVRKHAPEARLSNGATPKQLLAPAGRCLKADTRSVLLSDSAVQTDGGIAKMATPQRWCGGRSDPRTELEQLRTGPIVNDAMADGPNSTCAHRLSNRANQLSAITSLTTTSIGPWTAVRRPLRFSRVPSLALCGGTNSG